MLMLRDKQLPEDKTLVKFQMIKKIRHDRKIQNMAKKDRWMVKSASNQGITRLYFLHSVSDLCSWPWQKKKVAGHQEKQFPVSCTFAEPGLSAIKGPGTTPNKKFPHSKSLWNAAKSDPGDTVFQTYWVGIIPEKLLFSNDKAESFGKRPMNRGNEPRIWLLLRSTDINSLGRPEGE